jgi:hypothetical protein
MSRLDWKEGGRFDRQRETQAIEAALRGHQNAQVEDEIGYWRFWKERSETHNVYDEPTGAGLVFHPEVMVPVLHATHGEGPTQDTEGGFYYVDDLYVTCSFDQFSRTGLTEADIHHDNYLRDRISYDGRLFRVSQIHVTGQISQRDFVLSIEGSQLKPDEYMLDPQFAGSADIDNPALVAQPQAGLFTGTGPPPDDIPGAKPGDEYIDMSTGKIYRLEG